MLGLDLASGWLVVLRTHSGADSIRHGGARAPSPFTNGWARGALRVEKQQTRN